MFLMFVAAHSRRKVVCCVGTEFVCPISQTRLVFGIEERLRTFLPTVPTKESQCPFQDLRTCQRHKFF